MLSASATSTARISTSATSLSGCFSRTRSQSPERTISAIIETLAERVYAHGHAIGITEAKGIGLPVKPADDVLDGLMWQLLNEYEQDLKLLDPIDPAHVITGTDSYSEDASIAVIEST